MRPCERSDCRTWRIIGSERLCNEEFQEVKNDEQVSLAQWVRSFSSSSSGLWLTPLVNSRSPSSPCLRRTYFWIGFDLVPRSHQVMCVLSRNCKPYRY